MAVGGAALREGLDERFVSAPFASVAATMHAGAKSAEARPSRTDRTAAT
jgi:hypothetical protein